MIIKKYLTIFFILCLFLIVKTRVWGLFKGDCDSYGCDPGSIHYCQDCRTIGICATEKPGTCGNACSSTNNACCDKAGPYSKWSTEVCLNKTRVCVQGDDLDCVTASECLTTVAFQTSACSIGNKCKSENETFLRAGGCDCGSYAYIYQLCCSNTIGVGPVGCNQLSWADDGQGMKEGGCPSGSSAMLIPGWARINSDNINQGWIDSVCSVCTATNGQCSTSDGACAAGSVSDWGATSTVANDGIYSLWNCNGTCGSTTNASCSYKTCSSVAGSCGPSDGTCSAGSVSDWGVTTAKSDGIYSIWDCNGTCASTTNASCEFKLCNRVDGVCGSPADGCFPPTANFCTTTYGNTAITTNSNTFTWNCNGDCSGVQSPTCISTRLIINGQCGTANGGNYTSTPAAYLCSVGTASAVSLSGTTYSWSCNRNCNGTTDFCTAIYDTIPTLSTTVLKNTSGTAISADAQGRYHSCDATFAGSKTSLWTITASDANGTADIKTIDLRFILGANIYDFDEVTNPAGGVATFTADTTTYVPGTYNVEYLLEDKNSPPGSTGWLNTGRVFKVWNCEVIVDGTIYDNSANLSCANGGFTTTIPTDIQPFEFAYGDMTDNSTRNMTVVSPRFYSPQTLTWQNTYFLDNFDVDDFNFLGVFNNLKINDVCIFPRNTHILPRNYVDAYSTSPKIEIKYSAVMDQEAWFRVRDGSVLADVEVENYVPVTCVGDYCKTSVGGLVWSKKVNLSDYDEGKPSSSEAQPQPPFRDYYEALKYDIHGGLNVGTTIAGSIGWSGVGSTRGVIFVGGDLTIDQNMVIGANDYVFFIVKGKITIDPNVTQVNGLFYADGTINALGENDTKLAISGSLYGRSGVILSRSYKKKRSNNANPAVEVTFDPNLIFKLPKGMWETYDNWTLE